MGTDSSEFKKRPGARKKFERRTSSSVKAEWETVDRGLLARVVSVLTRDNRAVRFGYSRDQGAFAVGIYGDGDKPYTVYCGVNDDVDEWLKSIVYEFDPGDQ